MVVTCLSLDFHEDGRYHLYDHACGMHDHTEAKYSLNLNPMPTLTEGIIDQLLKKLKNFHSNHLDRGGGVPALGVSTFGHRPRPGQARQ